MNSAAADLLNKNMNIGVDDSINSHKLPRLYFLMRAIRVISVDVFADETHYHVEFGEARRYCRNLYDVQSLKYTQRMINGRATNRYDGRDLCCQSRVAMPRKISCTVIAKDEADRIAICLRSVLGIVDEIIVVDSGSSDQTVAISETFGARCFYRPWTGFGPQKRFAEDMARHDWILNIDADEWLTDDLRQEIQCLAKTEPRNDIAGYTVKIKAVYPGDDRPRLFADQHVYVRLYNKTMCRFPESAAFDEIRLPRNRRQRLNSPMFHRSIRSLSHLIEKNIKYYGLQSAEKHKSKPIFLLRLGVEPFATFFKYYLLRRHFTGGYYGFLIAMTMAVLRTYRLLMITFPRRMV